MKVKFNSMRQIDGFCIVEAEPTTKAEKHLIDSAVLMDGVYKPWVYELLLDAAEYHPGKVLENPLDTVYDEIGELYDTKDYCDSVLHDEMKNDNEWYDADTVAYILPCPSTLCLLSLYDFFKNKRYENKYKKLGKLRRLSKLKKKIDNLSTEYTRERWSLTKKEETTNE